MTDDQPEFGGKDAALLETIRERFDYAYAQWQTIREEGRTDIKYVAGDPWDAADRQARKDAGRPCISVDELGQYLNQVVNEVRANPRAIKFSPTGNGANDKTARFYADKTREIEYRSHAQIAYTTAFENAVQRSYGFCRLNTKYVNDRSNNQELWIEEVANPDSVIPDPDALRPDSSDMKYCFVIESRTVKEFQREFPKAKVQDFSPDLKTKAPHWLGNDRVQIAEYWTIETTDKELLTFQLPDGSLVGLFDDELEQMPEGAQVVARRNVDVPEVCQYLTNGVEILKKTPWKGKYIPIVSCYGKVLWMDDGSGPKRVILSMTRLARSPYMAYCFAVTGAMEAAGSTTKNPYWAYEGQLSPEQLANIAKSMHEPVAALTAKERTELTPPGTILPLPQRNSLTPDLGGWTVLMEFMRRAIQAAMAGSPLPTSAQRRNEKSGVALKQIEESGQKGSYHFIDHYNYMIQHMGVMIEDLMPKVLDTSRAVTILDPKGDAQTVKLITPGSTDDTGGEDEYSVEGDHAVTVSVGPEYESEREQGSEFADAIFTRPEILQIIGPEKSNKLLALAIRLKNIGPIGDEMVDVIDPSPEDAQADPAMLQAKVQEATQIIEAAKQEIDMLKQQIATDAVKQQAETERAAMNNATKEALEDMKAKLAVILQSMKDRQANTDREDSQAHEVALAAAEAAETQQAADKAMLAGMAKPDAQPTGGAGA